MWDRRTLVALVLLTGYVVITLIVTDLIMAASIGWSIPQKNYGLAAILFFLAGLVFSATLKKHELSDLRTLSVGALSAYLPLVFIGVGLTFHRIESENPDTVSVLADLCAADIRVGECGTALAASFYLSALRALPLVLTVPALYGLLVLRLKRSCS